MSPTAIHCARCESAIADDDLRCPVCNLKTATVLRGLEARRYAFPAWVLAYRYRNRLFRTVLSGQDATRLMGEAPYSTARIVAAVAGAVAVMVVLSLLGLFL